MLPPWGATFHHHSLKVVPTVLLGTLSVFCFWLHWVFIAVHRLSLIGASRSYSPVAVWGLHITVATVIAGGFPVDPVVKNAAMQEPQEMRVPSLSWEDPLEEGMETHSSVLAWRRP